MIEFTIEGKPQGKQRPRFARGHTYTPKKTKEYEELVAWSAKEVCDSPIAEPCTIGVGAVFEVPKSYSKVKREACLRGEIVPKYPDVDNILKIVMDSCNGIAYLDDSQIYSACVNKEYGEKAHVHVIITL